MSPIVIEHVSPIWPCHNPVAIQTSQERQRRREAAQASKLAKIYREIERDSCIKAERLFSIDRRIHHAAMLEESRIPI